MHLSEKPKTIILPKIIFLTVLAVAFWKGLWWLFDTYLFPENIILGNLLCLILPIIIIIIWIMVSRFRISWNMDFPIDHQIL